MPRTFDDAAIDTLLADGQSINQTADRLGIPRTNLKRYLKKRAAPPEASQVDRGLPESTETLMVYPSQPQSTSSLTPRQVDDLSHVLPVLLEMAREWVEHRQLMQVDNGQPKSTVRWTYHVDARFVQTVKEYAKVHRLSESAVVNLALQRFFQVRQFEVP